MIVRKQNIVYLNGVMNMDLKADLTKVTLFLLISLLFYGCNAVKRVDEDRHLLTQNEVVVDGQLIKDSKVYSLISQRPNNKIPVLGLRSEERRVGKEYRVRW